jgi:hypothetical protein
LVSDGKAAWSVKTGEMSPRRMRVYRLQSEGAAFETIRPRFPSDMGRVRITGLAGVDPRFLYLQSGVRYDIEKNLLERGHLDIYPEIEVFQTVIHGVETWYLARDVESGGAAPARVWLLYSLRGGTAWNRVEVGHHFEAPRLEADAANLFLISKQGRILRFDKRSLRLMEDLSPMLPESEIIFFSADERYFWVQTIDQGADTSGRLWRIDRDVLDGTLFQADPVPHGFLPLIDDGGRLWFAALDRRSGEPLISVDKEGASTQPYGITGRHARHWRNFGLGLARTGIVVTEIAAGAVLVAGVIVTAPIWIPIVLVNDL